MCGPPSPYRSVGRAAPARSIAEGAPRGSARLGSARLGSALGSIAAVGRPRSAAPPDTDRPGPHQHTGGSAYLPTDSTTEILTIEFIDREFIDSRLRRRI